MNSYSGKCFLAIRMLPMSWAAVLALLAGGYAALAMDSKPSMNAASASAHDNRRKERAIQHSPSQPPLPGKRDNVANATSRPTIETPGQRLLRKGFFDSPSGTPNGGH